MASGKENKLKCSLKSSLVDEATSTVKPVMVDLTFLSSVSKKYCCTLCQNLLSDPRQVSCCKAMYCKGCIDRLTGKCANGKCGKTYTVISEGAVDDTKKKIQQFKVYCIKRSKGCKWTGTLENLENKHFCATYDKKDTSACQFQTVKCPNDCGEMVLRGKVEDHRVNECSKEMQVCEYCGMEDSKAHINKVHHRVCPAMPVDCPNKCRTTGVARSDILIHLEEKCPLRVVHCGYRNVGCNEQLLYRDLPEHNATSYQKHLDLMSEKLDFITNENHDLRVENESLHEEVANLMSKMKDFKSMDSLRDSYIFMDPVRVRPLLSSAPQPSLTSTTLGTEFTDSRTQQEGNDSGYGSIHSTTSSGRSLPEKSLGFDDQDCSPGFEKPDAKRDMNNGLIVDEGNVYEDLDNAKFDTFRKTKPPAIKEPQKSGSESSLAPLSQNRSNVPLPDIPGKSHVPLPAVPIPTDDALSSTYDVPVSLRTSAHRNQTPGSGNVPNPCEYEQVQSKRPPVLSSIYEDLDKVVEGNDYQNARRGSLPTNSLTEGKKPDESSSQKIPVPSRVNSSARFESIAKQPDTQEATTANIPIIQLQSPSNDDLVLLHLMENEASSAMDGYENVSKTLGVRKNRRKAPQIAPRKPVHKELQPTKSIADPMNPTPRPRCSTVGDVRSLKNIKINRRLVEAVKPGSPAAFQQMDSPLTDTPIPPPRSSPRHDASESSSRPTSTTPVNEARDDLSGSSNGSAETGSKLGSSSTSTHLSDSVSKQAKEVRPAGSKPPTPLPKARSKSNPILRETVSKSPPLDSTNNSKTATLPAINEASPKSNSKANETASKSSSKPPIESKTRSLGTPPKTGPKPPIAPKILQKSAAIKGGRARVGSEASFLIKGAPKVSTQPLKHPPLHHSASLPQNVKQPSLIKELTSKLQKDQLTNSMAN